MSKITKEEIISIAKNAAAKVDGPISRAEFIQESGISEWLITRHFPVGRWTELRQLAGIERHPKDNVEYSKEDCIQELHRVVTKLGIVPTIAVYTTIAEISDTKLKRTFGSWKESLKAYGNWLQDNHPDSPLLEAILSKTQSKVKSTSERKGTKGTSHWNKIHGPEYGGPLNFRGLRHAPINEQGVVYLFGMISEELGFIVEAVHAAFPDCEAKRKVSKDRWQRVRIEFEFRSVNFRDHGHNPEGADLIVCWEHNWPECPLEILELKTAI